MNNIRTMDTVALEKEPRGRADFLGNLLSGSQCGSRRRTPTSVRTTRCACQQQDHSKGRPKKLKGETSSRGMSMDASLGLAPGEDPRKNHCVL